MLGLHDRHEALLVDAGVMDDTILRFVEENGYTLLGILLTHDHIKHTRGLRTIRHIYDAPIYAAASSVFGYETNIVKDGDAFDIGGFHVDVISVPGHSPDSVVYRIERCLFTGDALTAGMMGKTGSSYSAVRQFMALRNKIFTLYGNYLVLPGHGPPSTLDVERESNIELARYLNRERESNSRRLALELM
jgi:glyoxylase-like metal-dependent hydrolase (beta-lactamase superfamily II)